MIQTLRRVLSERFKFHKHADGSSSFTFKNVQHKAILLNVNTNQFTSLQYNQMGTFVASENQLVKINTVFGVMYILKVEELINGKWVETHELQGCGFSKLEYTPLANQQRVSILPMTSIGAVMSCRIIVEGVS